LGNDKILTLPASESGASSLAELVNIYLQGQKQPDVFFTGAMWAYIQQKGVKQTKATKSPLQAAKAALEKEMEYDRSLQQLYANIENLTELLNPAFEAQCEELIFPVWESMR
jgi:exodeoxyribonuclease V gamma subunit